MATYEVVLAEVNARVNERVRKDATLNRTEAIATVFKEDPELYRLYRMTAAAQQG